MEFAQALAMWAAHYLKLVEYQDHNGTCDLLGSFKMLPILGPDVDRIGIPPLVEKRLLDKNEKFHQSVMSLKLTGNASDSISSLTQLGAAIYLANADYFPLIFLHAVTIPSALRLVLPYIDRDYHKRAIFYVWQVVAGSVSAYGVQKELPAVPSARQSSKVWVKKAVDTLDEHAIKLVDACLREESNPASGLCSRSRGLGGTTGKICTMG